MPEHEARLGVLGQIQVLRSRLDRIEDLLVDLPMSNMPLTDLLIDAIGNASLQAGALAGTLTVYQEAER